MKKRIGSLLLALVMTLGLLPMSALATESTETPTNGPCDLQSISITGYLAILPDFLVPLDLTPEFSAQTQEYSVDELPCNTYGKISVEAIPAAESASIKITLNTEEETDFDGSPTFFNMTPGIDNIISITVTNGENSKTYTVTIPVAADPSTPPVDPADPDPVQVMHNIAAKYAESGIAQDENYPWLAADLVAYAQCFPNTESKLNQAQIQAVLDKLIANANTTSEPSDLAKDIIALRALGYDARKVVTETNQNLDVVKKLTDMVDEKLESVSNTWTLPYVVIALQQGKDYATQAQMDWLLQTAVDSQKSWMDTTWGPDGATPMVLALAPYYSDEAIKTAVDVALVAIAGTQKEDGSLGNAASTGLGLAAYAALGQTGPTQNEKTLTDGLMTEVADTLDGFQPTSNSFNTEQGFRGLVAAAKKGRVFDFDNMPMNTAKATLATGCPVNFHVVPDSATVEVKKDGKTQPSTSGTKYYLAAGDYTYTVSKSGYLSETGEFTVSAEEAEKHTARTIPVSLSKAPDQGAKDIEVKVKVLTHNENDCKGAYTYKHNPSTYTTVVAEETVTLSAGQTVFEALQQTLEADKVTYAEKSYGYIDAINGISEFSHGKHSGWLYMVNGSVEEIGCRDKVLRSDATVIWFFTDDYTKEYGSENWGGTPPEVPVDDASTIPPATVDKDGTATAEVDNKTVDKLIDSANKNKADSIVITPEVKGEAHKIAVELPKSSVSNMGKETAADLTVETDIAHITIPNKGLETLGQERGDKVTISAEHKSDGTVAVEVKVGNAAVSRVDGGLTVSLPDKNAAPGTVLVLVDKNGAETVVKKSAVQDGQVTGLVDGSCTVKLADHAKDFDDTKDHWGQSAIRFVTARDLYNGVNDASFVPNGDMTRGMLVTVLHRLEDGQTGILNSFPDVDQGQWYSDGVGWGSETKIITGYPDGTFGVNDQVSREQIAVILYRYAQHLGMDTTAKGNLGQFSDANRISDYTKEGLTWCVGAGLMGGKSGHVMDPRGNATRAEVATMLERMVTLMVR